MAKYSGGLLGKAYNEVGNFVSRNPDKIDKALRDSIREAADRFSGYEVHAYSGYRPGDKRQHGKAKAIDVALVDKRTGKVLDNYQNASTFRTYEKFAQTVREVQMEKYPDLANDLRWGGYFSGPIGQYGAVDVMHFDLAGNIGMAGGSWEDGLTDAQRALFPGIESVGMNHVGLPDTMEGLPQTREQALSQIAAEQAIAKAYNDPMRALDTIQAERPSALAPAPVGDVQRAPLAGLPSPLNAAPVGAVERGPALAPPSLPSSFPARPGVVGSLPARPSLPSNFPSRPGAVGSLPAARPATPSVNAVRPSAPTIGGMPAARQQTTVASRPATPSATGLPAARQQTTIAGRPATPAPTGLPAAPVDRSVAPANPGQLGGITMSNPSLAPATAPSTAALAAQYGQYRTPTNYQNVREALLATPPAVPVAPPVAPPIAVTPPVEVLAPKLVPRPPVQDMPVYQAPPAPPALRPSDIYSGTVGTALDSVGNTIGRDNYGTTTVTNQYGATTGMTPGGYQTAYGSMPSIPGISGPDMGKLGGAVKGAIPGVAGSALGGLFGGPAGAILGGLLAKELTKPGGALSGTRNIDTSALAALGFGPVTAFAKPRTGGIYSQFPDRPSGGYRGGPTSSNLSRGEMDSISPGASAAIGRGVGGLY